jgi:hypothetical protein
MVADASEVGRAFRLFCDADHACEVRALTTGAHRSLDGGDVDGLVEAVRELPSGIGIYFVLNPLPVGLDSPATNADVVYRRWVYIDVDPPKPDGKGKSATDAEKESAVALGREVQAYLAAHAWPAPVVVDSGNGVALYYLAELPNDELVRAAYSRLLGLLGKKFAHVPGSIDRSVHSAAQLVKLPGTWARKGPDADDRPHRPCEITFVPKSLEKLTFDELKVAGEGGDEKPAAEGLSNGAKPTTEAARRCLEAGCARIVMAAKADEGRNNALNAAAFDMGRKFINVGSISRKEVEERLYEAACESGLDTDHNCGPEGIRKTIASGLGSGEKKRPEPIPTIKGTTAESNGKPGPDRLTVSMANVKPAEVDWLVRNRIPKRFITVFSGRTGIGKSYVALDLVARISRGGEVPLAGGERFTAGGTLVLSEDPHEYVIAPRLIDAGAELERIHAMTWEAMGKYQLGDTEMLSRACAEVPGGVSVVMIDPPTNFLEGTDEHKNAEVRQLVMKVVEWAIGRDVAVLFILHVNKNVKGVEALNRVMGSVAWVTTARIAHAFCADPDDRSRSLWVPMKNNLGPLEKAIAFRIVKDGGTTTVRWEGEIDTTADDAMGREPDRKRRDIRAGEWLVDQFRTRLEWESGDLFERARQDGVSRNAIFEAKESLKLPRARRQVKENGEEVYIWWVSVDWLAEHSKPPRCPTTGTSGTPGQ